MLKYGVMRGTSFLRQQIEIRTAITSRSHSLLKTKTPPSRRTIHTTPENVLKDKPFLQDTLIRFIQKFKRGSIDTTKVVHSTESQTKKVGVVDLLSNEMKQIQDNIFSHLTNVHPFLQLVGRYYFDLGGKRFRPLVLLATSKALESHITENKSEAVSTKQLKLAEIVEMIHTASIIHDDVIDKATTRRSKASINIEYGNKFSVLSGDFLLAKASVALASLENFEVTRLISCVIADLVEGEFMQMKPSPVVGDSDFEYYLKKTFLKTGSMIANGCRATAVLSGAPQPLIETATEYGKNLGLAFQLIDDLLDFTGTSETLGKEAAIDLQLGLATAPVLFAREQFPELNEMILRKFENEGDVEKARELVAKSDGLRRTKELAEFYGNKATEALQTLNASKGKDALSELIHLVLHRDK